MNPMRPLVPDDLAELPRWAIWRKEGGNKIPYRVDGRRADSTNQTHWSELEDARRAFESGRYSGLAFAFFREDGLVGIDLDDSLDGDGNPNPQFRPLGAAAREETGSSASRPFPGG